MQSLVGCVLNAPAVSGESVRDLVSRFRVSALFVRGAVSLRASPPVSGAGRAPGVRLSDDDSELKSALGAAIDAGIDGYVVLSDPFVGAAGWGEFLGVDSAGRKADAVDAAEPVLCPTHPKLIAWLAAAAAEVARIYKPAGILLENYALGRPERIESLFFCWCDRCRAKAEDLGYDEDRIRIGMQGAHSDLEEAGQRLAGLRDVGLVQFIEGIGYDTGLLDWLNYRADLVSAALYEVRQAVSNVDSGVRVGILSRAPSVAILAGQRRADGLRDTTLCDFFAPVIAGESGGVAATIAAYAGMLRDSADALSEADAITLAARLHGYGAVPMPDSLDALTGEPDAACVRAAAARELNLSMAVGGTTPQWPAIDATGLPPGLAAELADAVRETRAEGILFLGVPT
jgi:hypothetical protein